MLIMLYASTYLLLGPLWNRRSAYRPVVGVVYPILAAVLALITMVSPLSRFLLWLGPFFEKGSAAEWVMLAVHLAVPTLLLALVWRGRMKQSLSLSKDFPVFAVVVLFHLADIGFAMSGGFTEVLALVVGISVIHIGFLGLVYYLARKIPGQSDASPPGLAA
jgi:hypothetical protein